MAPKLQSYAALAYDRFLNDSSTQVLRGQEVAVWSGPLMKTLEELGIPKGSYTAVMNALREIGSIEMLDRGSRGGYPTVIALIKPPTQELWDGRLPRDSRLTRRPSSARLQAELAEIRKSLGGMDVVEAIRNIETRLTRLERKEK